MDFHSQSNQLQILRSMINDFHNLYDLVKRLQHLVLQTYKISISLQMDEALKRIITAVCDSLYCERASVFIVDELNNELLLQRGKGLTKTIRLPRDVGLVGYVAVTGKRLNIDDAYLDPRFNKEFDKQNRFRTKSILTVPVKDHLGNTTALVQAINKHEKKGGKFSADDEGLLLLLAH